MMLRCNRCGAQRRRYDDALCDGCRKEVRTIMDKLDTGDVQNTTQLEFDEGASLRKQMGLITPAELATALGVSEVTLQVWRQKGNGPRFTKLGKNIFYPMREVQHWTETNILERVNERTVTEAPIAHYKSGKIVDIIPSKEVTLAAHGDISSADEIDTALTALIGPKDD